MQSKKIEISNEIKLKIGYVIHQCNVVYDEINAIFYLGPEETLSSNRQTSPIEEKLIEFLVVTHTPEAADKLLACWIKKEEVGQIAKDFHRKIIIVSEKEFVEEFGTLNGLCERIVSGVIVYDRDGQQIIAQTELEVVE